MAGMERGSGGQRPLRKQVRRIIISIFATVDSPPEVRLPRGLVSPALS